MAIEIKELHVKVHMDETETAKGGEAKTSADVPENNTQEHLVEDITREVLRILKEQKER